jgi:hypothetical protein
MINKIIDTTKADVREKRGHTKTDREKVKASHRK